MIDWLTNILQTTVIYSTPLILAGIGGLFSERAGIVNIGLEGLMTIGAFVSALTTIYTGNPWIGLFSASVAGMMLSLPHAVSCISYKADQVVSGVAINFLALGLSVYLVKRIFDGAGQTPIVENKLNSIAIPYLSSIPIVGPSIFNALPTTYIAIIVVFLSYFIMYRTSFGMRLRAVGEHPHAAESAGINVISIRYLAVMLSGVFAGLGGAGLSIAIGSEFNQNTVAGQGFIALAALIFGKWRPFGVLGAALFFGFAVSLSLTGQLINLTDFIPSEVLNMIPYILTILALAGFVGSSDAPASIGRPYERGSRV